MAANATSHLQIQIEATNDDDGDDFSYLDFMMLGRTGMGKSTVGNKLLGIDPDTREPYKKGVVIDQCGYDGDEKYFFETGDGKVSITKKCKVLRNDNVRVMDTTGFADTELTAKYGVIQGNLQSFRWILQAQKAYDMRFTRVLYFFPSRGPPERAEGTLQEEIKVMYGFFGQKIFDIMVVVVTNNKQQLYQKAGFSAEDLAHTKEVFQFAFEKIITEERRIYGYTTVATSACPPVVYVPFEEDHEEVFRLINGAEVISDAETFIYSPEYPMNPKFRGESSDLPSDSSFQFGATREEIQMISQHNRGKRFSFEDRCTRCAVKLVHEKLESGKVVPVSVIYSNGDKDFYDHSFCHPLFIPKYTRVQRFFGGVAHIVVLGLGKLYEYVCKKRTWPTFTSSEEVCIKCEKPPGSQSCHPIKQPFKIGKEWQEIDHTCEMDLVKLVEESTSTETTP